MLEFVWPLMFLLLPLPLLVYIIPPANRQEAALRVPFFAALEKLTQTGTSGSNRSIGLTLLVLLAWILLVSASARPQWVGDPVTLPTSGRDLMLAVDISYSMSENDMEIGGERVRRLDAVKEVVGDFVKRRKGDRLGLILFGTQAYLQTPLSFDRNTVETQLKEAELGFAGRSTAIGDAIGLAIKRLRDRPENSRVLVLLTDGANTAGEIEPRQASELAALEHIRIHTIGIGADSMQVPGLFGTNFGARTVNPSRDLDEPTLKAIAENTGGKYFRARNPKELEYVYAALDRLEPVEQEAQTMRPIQSLLHWPLGIAWLLSIFIAIYFSSKRLRHS